MHKITVALLGDPAVGKTSLVRRFVLDQFSDEYLTTVGAKPMKKELRLDTGKGEEKVQMILWDVVGHPGYRTVQSLVFDTVQGVLLVDDITREETREGLVKYWIPRVTAAKPGIPLVVVANKLDLTSDRWAALKAVKQFGSRTGLPHFLTSAKTGERVEDALFLLASCVVAGSRGPSSASGDGTEEDVDPMVSVTDRIIGDFCGEVGGVEKAMPIIHREVARAGLDVRAPTWETVRLFIANLAGVERCLLGPMAADAQARHLEWLWEAASPSGRGTRRIVSPA